VSLRRSPRDLTIIALLLASGGVVGLISGSIIVGALMLTVGVVFAIMAVTTRHSRGEKSSAS
jgi:hypothetical protein